MREAEGFSMQVDFYILEASGAQERLRTACRLAEKAWGMGHRVFIHTDSREAARSVDDLLWTYRQDSFVPHARYSTDRNADSRPTEPVLVGDGSTPVMDIDVLINLTETVPLFVDKSTRVAEIVAGGEAARQAGRARYKSYRDRGLDIRQHDL
jgi:DNA polymerase-3 subunit chi